MQRYSNSQQSPGSTLQNKQQSTHSDIHKASFSFFQTNHSKQQGLNVAVLVYLHSHSKKSFKVQLSPKISIYEIKSIIEQKIGIKRERQILYLNGKNITYYGSIHLQHLSIIHISSTDQICASCQEIRLKLTIINSVVQSRSKIYKNFVALSTDRISDFIRRLQKEMSQVFKLKNQNIQYYLLQSSRLLQSQKTFLEQHVTRQSEIICMITRNQVKTRFTNDTQEEIIHDISELLGFGDESDSKKQLNQQEESTVTRSQTQLIKKQQVKKQNHQEQPQESVTCQAVPNFKKKKAPFFDGFSFEEMSKIRIPKKLRLLRKKKDLDMLPSSQSQQKLAFQASLLKKPEELRIESQYLKEKVTTKIPKPLPQIPKGMPINERRQIRFEIEKLFNLDESSRAKDQRSTETLDAKEQIKPISPPTEVPKQKMRLSMGSRPDIVAQLKRMDLQ